MMGIESSTGLYFVKMLFGGTFSQIWPILLLPIVAALISDRLTRLLPPTRADWRAAAALAAFPGLVMLALIGMIVGRALFHLHTDDLAHLVKYHVPLAIALGLLGHAAWQLYCRNRDLKAVIRFAGAPSPRLQRAAAEACLEVREIDDDGCECFVAGILRPRAFVSRGAVERMSDDELVAALHHERAHAASHDPAMLTVLSFLGDLAPGTDRALTSYRQARERRADTEAAERAGPCVLASALLAVSRQSHPPLPALGMVGSGANTWRLQAILGVEPDASPGLSSSKLWAGLTTNLGLTLWPLPHVYLAYRICCF